MHFKDMNDESANSKSIPELWNKSRSTSPPEQKVEYELFLHFAFILTVFYIELPCIG